jgi:hypothetical protein
VALVRARPSAPEPPRPHEFAWSAGAVSFETRLIDGPSLPVVVSRYTVDEGVPRAGRESPRINLWLVEAASNRWPGGVGGRQAVCVHSSEMIPWSDDW